MGQTTPLTGELNFIVSYFWNGCRTPFQLLIETARPISGEIALVFLTNDWQDIVTTFWRPKGLRQNRHGRKKRKGRGGGGIPSPLDLVSQNIDSLHDPFFGDPTPGTTFLWTIEQQIERISWTVAVIELSKTLVFETLLGVLELEATKCDVPGRAMAKGEEYEPFNNGQIYYLPCQDVIYEEWPCDVDFGTVYFNDGNYYQILASCMAQNQGDSDGWFELEIWVSAEQGGGVYRYNRQDLGPGAKSTANFSAIVKGEGFIQWYQRSQGRIVYPNYNISCIPSAFTT
jgi:hypothetical protein